MQLPRLRKTTTLTILLISTCAMAQTHGGGGRNTMPNTPSTRASSASTSPVNSPGSIPGISANSEGKIEFRTQTILIQVPVVITDKNGNHVHGLTKDDFHIFENGKEQKLSSSEELAAASGRLSVTALKPGQFGNLTLSEQQPRTVNVIALDTVNTPFLDQATSRRELVKYLANSLDSGQVLALMIITSRGLKVVQGLTGDTAQLQQILKKVSGEMPAMQGTDPDVLADVATGDIPDATAPALNSDPDATMQAFVERGDAIYAQFQQQNAIETTMNAFLGIAWSLSGVPGRKSLIWATGSFPFSIASPDIVPGGRLSELYEKTMHALTEAQISVYPVDVRGLVGSSAIADASRSRMPTTRQIVNRSWLQQSTVDNLNEFADMTGGKAFYNTNDLATSFKRAADDASSYYMLSYYLDMHNDHAGWRTLKVKVDKKDTEIRARKGFFVTNATIHSELTKNSDLSYAITSPIEGTGVPVIVEWTGITDYNDKKKAAFQIRMPANAVTINTAAQNKVDFDFIAVAWSEKDGKDSGHTSVSFAKPLQDAQLASIRANGLNFKGAIDLTPGKYNVRFVVRDNATGKVGSVTAPLTVN